jgi:hypothetical protein
LGRKHASITLRKRLGRRSPTDQKSTHAKQQHAAPADRRRARCRWRARLRRPRSVRREDTNALMSRRSPLTAMADLTTPAPQRARGEHPPRRTHRTTSRSTSPQARSCCCSALRGAADRPSPLHSTGSSRMPYLRACPARFMPAASTPWMPRGRRSPRESRWSSRTRMRRSPPRRLRDVFGLENLQVPVDGILARAETSLRTAGLWERRAENPEHQVPENTVWDELTVRPAPGRRARSGRWAEAAPPSRHRSVDTALSTPLWPREPRRS